MVIAPGTKGITAHVILGDNEALPHNLNSEKVIVYRRGKSTDMELTLVKPLGVLASEDLLRDPTKPVCNYDGNGNPLHEHADGTHWFYEETWAYENGPFPTYDEAWNALAEYCMGLEQAKQTVIEMENERMAANENSESVPEAEVEDGVDNRAASASDVPTGAGSVGDGVED